jgi:type II secretory pathway pseudopilin PulG
MKLTEDQHHLSTVARHSGQSLIGLLVVIALIMVLAVAMLGPRMGSDGVKRPGVYKQSMNRAEDVGLNSNISQIQQVITMYRNDNEGKPPASLEELRRYAKDYPAEMWVDPLTRQPLIYDPATGTISAPPRPAELSPETPANAPRNSPLVPGAPASGAPGGINIPNMQPQTPADDSSAPE